MKSFLSVFWIFVVVAAAVVLSGCATSSDAENQGARPWNAPMNWEHGLPPSMMEGR